MDLLTDIWNYKVSPLLKIKYYVYEKIIKERTSGKRKTWRKEGLQIILYSQSPIINSANTTEENSHQLGLFRAFISVFNNISILVISM